MSDKRDRTILLIPVKRVFALEVRQEGDSLAARIVGFSEEDAVPERHLPPLPEVVEANSAPYRRLLTHDPR